MRRDETRQEEQEEGWGRDQRGEEGKTIKEEEEEGWGRDQKRGGGIAI